MTRKERKRLKKDQVKKRKLSDRVSKRLSLATERDGLMDDGGASANVRADVSREPRSLKYVRVSSGGSLSLSEQLVEIEKYCEINDIEIVEEFRDVAPGRTEDRTGFNRMLSEIRKRRVDFIVCWKGDRLARSVSAANLLLEALVGTDTEFIAVQEREEISWTS